MCTGEILRVLGKKGRKKRKGREKRKEKTYRYRIASGWDVNFHHCDGATASSFLPSSVNCSFGARYKDDDGKRVERVFLDKKRRNFACGHRFYLDGLHEVM